MLCQFSFENFRSFKDEIVLDLHSKQNVSSSDTSEHYESVISISGPTGSGKSNTLKALMYLKWFVLRYAAICSNETSDTMEYLNNEFIGPQYYLFREDTDKYPMKFKVLFRHKSIEYRYILHILNDEIIREKLSYREEDTNNAFINLIDRSEAVCIISGEVTIPDIHQIRKSIPLLTYIGTTFNYPVIENALDWFSSIAILTANEAIPTIPEDGTVRKKQFLELLNDMDIPIKDFYIEKDLEGKAIKLFTIHYKDGNQYELDYNQESSGTRKVINSLNTILDSLEKGSLLIADELETYIHPDNLNFMQDLYKNPCTNKNHSQLLLTQTRNKIF